MSQCSFTSIDEAHNYQEISSLENKDGMSLIDLVNPEKGAKILDLGCGTGFLSNVLAELVGPKGLVVAVDPDVERLAVAKSRYTKNNLHFIEGSAEDFPRDDYDIIFCNHVLHWVRKRSTVFAKMAGLVKPGGKIAFNYTIQHSHSEDKYGFISTSFRQKLLGRESDLVRPDECDILTVKFSFKQLHRSQHDCVHTFNNEEEYVEFFLTHWKLKAIQEKDINMEAIYNRKKRDDGLIFKYPVQTIVMQKNI